MVETRQLKDSLMNQSYALKDLVNSKMRLQKDLRLEKELREAVAVSSSPSVEGGIDRRASLKSPIMERIFRRSEEVCARAFPWELLLSAAAVTVRALLLLFPGCGTEGICNRCCR